jgi:hypothetical protein
VWGNVTISVQDVPDAPAAPVRTGTFTGGQLTLSYAAPQANNSPLTRFRLTGTGSAGGSYSKDCGLTTVCTLTDLDPEQTFRFTVVATNGLGDSAPSAASPSYSADFVPAPPTGVTVVPVTSSPRVLNVSWNAVPKPARGTSVLAAGGYVVEVNGVAVQTVSGTSASLSDLQAGSTYSVSVYAKNRAQVSSDADWARSGAVAAVAVGTPGTFAVVAQATRNQVSISWNAPDAAGATSLSYTVYRQQGSGGATGCRAAGERVDGVSGTSVVDSVPAGSYTYTVVTSNGVDCSSATTTAESVTPPGAASASVTVEAYQGDSQYKVQAKGLRASGTVSTYQYDVNGTENWRGVSDGEFIEVERPDGVSMDIRVRACAGTSRLECGEASPSVSVTPENTRVDVTSCQVGQKLTLSAAAGGAAIDSVDVRFKASLLGQWGPPSSVGFTDSLVVPDDSAYVQVRGRAGQQTDGSWRPAGGLLDVEGLQCDAAL